jgi:hypothetical protein
MKQCVECISISLGIVASDNPEYPSTNHHGTDRLEKYFIIPQPGTSRIMASPGPDRSA